MSAALASPAAVPPTLADKLVRLRTAMAGFDGVLVAFSGGVDSSLLARIAHDELGERALAVTAISALMPAAEQQQAVAVAEGIGIRHRLVESHELEAEAFLVNPPDRCYVCKQIRFTALKALAAAEGLEAVVHGENADDAGAYRPGVRAAQEAGVRAPLLEADLSKAEVRELAHRLGLPNAEKAASPCLATRIPYGERVTLEALDRIGRAEAALRDLGFGDLRVRHHGDVARLELLPADLERAATGPLRPLVNRAVRDAGFRYVALDLAGFRSGSLNEVLTSGERQGRGHG